MDPFSSALGIAAAIKAKTISPREVVDCYLTRVERYNPSVNALIWQRDEALRQEAKLAEAAVMRGDQLPAFHGVPIPIKDLTEVQDWPTTLGSRAALDKIGRYDASAVRQLRQAGFLFMGRSNTPEFGSLPVTENQAYGATRNPWNLAHTPGGSSGGAAAAVAAGMAPVAHASDGGGSIRIPASCCGLVGLKPSRHRIPKGPFISETMHGFSTDGALTRSVADTAALLDVFAHFDRDAWYNAPKPEEPFSFAMRRDPGRLRIAYTTKAPLDLPVAQDAIDALEKTARSLSALGHHVFAGEPDWRRRGDQLAEDFLAVWYTGTAPIELSDWSLVEPLNQGLRAKGFEQNSMEYTKAVLRLQMFSRETVAYWGRDFDLLLTPSLALPPPKIGWLYETGETDPVSLLWRSTLLCPYSSFCNVTGQPAISLPVHWNAEHLPIGAQLIGAPFGEAQLLQVAWQLEKELAWDKHRPKLS